MTKISQCAKCKYGKEFCDFYEPCTDEECKHFELSYDEENIEIKDDIKSYFKWICFSFLLILALFYRFYRKGFLDYDSGIIVFSVLAGLLAIILVVYLVKKNKK